MKNNKNTDVRKKKTGMAPYMGRLYLIFAVFAVAVSIIGWKLSDLQVVNNERLQGEGDKRQVRYETVAAHRGIILDRNGRPLAVSTPMMAIWANPKEMLGKNLKPDEDVPVIDWHGLGRQLGIKPEDIRQKVHSYSSKGFIYLRRQMTPAKAAAVLDLDVPGVYSREESKRYYPAGEVATHLVGFTNLDEKGQEGLELAYDEWLDGKEGERRIIKDRRNRLVKEAETISGAEPGKELMLSIDLRLQYLAYRELKQAVQQHGARSGSLVMVDVKTGEILALVNSPSFNPNNRKSIKPETLRNRAVTDIFEPGSVIKPFTIAAALESGRYTPGTVIETSPGVMRVGRNYVRDVRNYGRIDLTTVLTKSSNVGVSRIALDLGPGSLLEMFERIGLGATTGSGIPGEQTGALPLMRERWSKIETATLAFGYGLSVTPLQLAQAYTVLAADGIYRPLTPLKRDVVPQGVRVMSSSVVDQITEMTTRVVTQGTGRRAKIPSYSVAGKTGTVKKVGQQGYLDNRYVASFAGFAPVKDPRIVTVVILDDVGGKNYYGGVVAAPVFSKVTGGALRILGVKPDEVAQGSQRNIVAKNTVTVPNGKG
ncbi:peptidoglycan D,D-transpeptidase FtsI family protein [Endozoicomonadaceae bacterium StTr2]